MKYAGLYLNLVILLHRGLRHNMRFSRTEALLFWGVQNLVEEKCNVEVFFCGLLSKFLTAALLQYLYTGRKIMHRER